MTLQAFSFAVLVVSGDTAIWASDSSSMVLAAMGDRLIGCFACFTNASVSSSGEAVGEDKSFVNASRIKQCCGIGALIKVETRTRASVASRRTSLLASCKVRYSSEDNKAVSETKSDPDVSQAKRRTTRTARFLVVESVSKAMSRFSKFNRTPSPWRHKKTQDSNSWQTLRRKLRMFRRMCRLHVLLIRTMALSRFVLCAMAGLLEGDTAKFRRMADICSSVFSVARLVQASCDR